LPNIWGPTNIQKVNESIKKQFLKNKWKSFFYPKNICSFIYSLYSLFKKFKSQVFLFRFFLTQKSKIISGVIEQYDPLSHFGDFFKKQGRGQIALLKIPYQKKKKVFSLKLPKFFSPSAKNKGWSYWRWGHIALLSLISFVCEWVARWFTFLMFKNIYKCFFWRNAKKIF